MNIQLEFTQDIESVIKETNDCQVVFALLVDGQIKQTYPGDIVFHAGRNKWFLTEEDCFSNSSKDRLAMERIVAIALHPKIEMREKEGFSFELLEAKQ